MLNGDVFFKTILIYVLLTYFFILAALGLHCHMWALCWGMWVSLIAEHRLKCTESIVITTWAWLPCGIWDLHSLTRD